MRMVKCYECSKRYNYDEDGFCPNCGSFNQPASASRIGADGSVIWSEGINERNHSGSFVHKEYHAEEKKRRASGLDKGVDRIPKESKAVKPVRLPVLKKTETTGKKKTEGAIIAAAVWIIFLIFQTIFS